MGNLRLLVFHYVQPFFMVLLCGVSACRVFISKAGVGGVGGDLVC